ncbi:MAG TPA: hypothetical protein VK324_03180 [Tepidisphaeraceae bacterium]|nr:hypothetical protein [Tepidisphaeraceae bacterium]
MKAFRTHPDGPPPDCWPSPAILRRWLRRPTFRAALLSLRDTMRWQADLQLTAAAAVATHALQHAAAAVPTADLEAATAQQRSVTALTRLLRIYHLRQRFPAADPVPPPSAGEQADRGRSTEDLVAMMRTFHPDATVRSFLGAWDGGYFDPPVGAGDGGPASVDDDHGDNRGTVQPSPAAAGHG